MSSVSVPVTTARTLNEGRVAPPRWLVIAAFATIYIVWGTTYLAIAFAIDTVPPFVMSAIRFLFSGVLLFFIARVQGAPLPTWRNWRAGFIAGGLLFVLNNGLLVWGQGRGVPSGMAALLIGSTPMIMVLVRWAVHHQRPDRMTVIGLILGTFGVALLVNPFGQNVDTVGAVVIIISAGFWVIGSLYQRGAALPQSILMATAITLFGGGVLQSGVAILSGQAAAFDPAQVSAVSIVAMLYLAVVSSGLAFGAFTWLMRVDDPSRVATYAYVNPIVAVALGWLLRGERLEPLTLVAAATIIGAVFLITQSNAKRARQPAQPLPEAEVA